jgi:hypothetical protein
MAVFGDPQVVHVLVPSSAAARLIAGVRTHRARAERRIIQISGLSMTDPSETAVDLARLRHNAVGRAVADSALRIDTGLTRQGMIDLNEARISTRGRNIARWPLERCTALCETALESVSQSVVEWLGFPLPELQVPFISPDGEEDRVDSLWRAVRLAGEADGDLKYDGRFGDPRAVLRRQTTRDARLRRHHVRDVAHWGWLEATTFTPVRDILTGAGLEQIGPEDSAQLFAMKRLLAPRAPHATSAPRRENN